MSQELRPEARDSVEEFCEERNKKLLKYSTEAVAHNIDVLSNAGKGVRLGLGFLQGDKDSLPVPILWSSYGLSFLEKVRSQFLY